ncbi:MAG: DNA primase, partial [Anaerolineae bacterium]|nr:DNA primase [Anaerolineae bacterium]
MTSVDEIKTRLDIIDIVSESVELKRSGKNYSGFCPFHANTRTPAFVVFADSGTWRCFGECSEGGDIFSYVMKKEGWDFATALRELADRAGVELRPVTPQEQEQVEENDRLRDLLESAVTYYRHQLTQATAGKTALDYWHGRGFTDKTIEIFGLGYATDSWDSAANHFITKGFSEQDLIDAGLASERDSGGIYDRFRNRIMLPIRDERGRMAGFGARTLDPEGMPKYLNSPQTAIFDKSHILFGLDQARKTIRMKDQVVIVEGYMGVISPHQHGYNNVVATMGTALTENHLQMIKRFTRNIILAMDSDAAGIKATLRGLEVARKTLDREGDFRFNAHGLLRQEGRLKSDIRVCSLPPGMDPDDVFNDDPDRWEEIINAAKPIVIHVMETLAANQDLNDPKAKSEIANQVLPLIADVPSSIERDTYRQRLARLLQVNENTLVVSQKTSRPRRSGYDDRQTQLAKPAPQRKITSANSAVQTREVHILGVLIRHPDLIYHMDRQLQEDGLSRISENDFQHSDHQALFQLIKNSLEQDHAEPLNDVLNHLIEEMIPFVDNILAKTEKIDAHAPNVLEDILRALILL